MKEPEDEIEDVAALRRDMERRFARLESRLAGLEELTTALLAGKSRPRFGFPGLSPRALLTPALRHAAIGERDSGVGGAADTGPKFERGLDVPTAANWSRPVLLATGGITLLFFLLFQLFCSGGAPRPRRATAPARPAPAGLAPGGRAPAPPPAILFVTPANEPEGTETPAPAPARPPH
jgi:hypothetical protein